MGKPVITVEGLSKRYTLHHQARSGLLRDQLASLLRNPFRREKGAGNTQEEFWALKDVNFTVNQGDVLGIIGRNGAGKSTLLKILSRITEPTTGRITIQGRIASLLEVGTGFHGELSGRENIFLNGAILGMTRQEIRKKFDEIVAFSEVEKFLDTPVKHYSSGMYVRLAFAVAAHLEPEILIIDEVLAVGDFAFQKKCLGKMREIATGQGRTVLFVSHNTSAVAQLCTNALVLENGRLTFLGTVGEALSHYSAGFKSSTAQFKTAFSAQDSHLAVTSIRINRADHGVILIRSGETTLCCEAEVLIKESVQVSLEVHLRDQMGGCLALFSPGHLHPESGVLALEPGLHRLHSEISLPLLHQGHYSLDFALTRPGVLYYAQATGMCQLEVEGTATPTGVVFRQSAQGAGSLLLLGSLSGEPCAAKPG